tara:strand:+ start:2919 stop:3281 length:363 start_codon:yes stop_codon:yes gene_type:complete
MLGHLNNVVFHRCFEDIVTKFTQSSLGINWLNDPIYPVAVETQCTFFSELSWPEVIQAGLRAGHIGRSSVTYQLALFRESDLENASASGRFVHVYIARSDKRPTMIPNGIRTLIEAVACP